jgi:AraC-like DNA-binding protein
MEMKHGPIYHFPLHGDSELPVNVSFIGINYCLPNYRNVRSRSRITVIAYVLAGQGNVTCHSDTFPAKRGDVFILPKGKYHEVAADPGRSDQWEYIWFNITGELTLTMLDKYKLLNSVVIPDAGGRVGELFQQAIGMAQTNEALDMHNDLPILYHRILIELSNVQSRRHAAYSNKVQEIKHYLDNRFQADFDSKQLSRHFGLTFKEINRIFKKEMGMPVYQYVLAKKIETAKLMLQDTQLHINEIALQLGFSDSQYFSNFFKKKTGVSPSQFRMDVNRPVPTHIS